jgi:hypothetical protein
MVFIYRLRAEAGHPSMAKIADGVSAMGERTWSHTTVHKLFVATTLPSNGDLLFWIARWLHNQNRFTRRTDDDILDELETLWRRAWEHQYLTPSLPMDSGKDTTPDPAHSPAGPGHIDRTEVTTTVHRLAPVRGAVFGVQHAPTTGHDPASEPRPTSSAQPRSFAESLSPVEPTRSALATAAERPVFTPASVTGLVADGFRDSALPDLRTSRAVLAGTSVYRDPYLADLPAVAAGVKELSWHLSRPGGVVDHTTTLIDPTQRELSRDIVTVCTEAEDLLLLHFSGHGLVSDQGELLLATTDTEASYSQFSAVEFRHVRDTVMRSRARKKLVILDCCFSGRALDAMGPLDALATIPSTTVITATSGFAAAFAPAGTRYTAFTELLLDVLATGVPGAGPLLSTDDVFQAVAQAAADKNLPTPHKLSTPRGFALCTNPAHREPHATTEDLAAVLTWNDLGTALNRERRATGLSLRALQAATVDISPEKPLRRSMIAAMCRGRAITRDRLWLFLQACQAFEHTSWDDWNAAAQRADENPPTTEQADRELLKLATANGAARQMLETELTRYSFGVLDAWLRSGHIFTEFRRQGLMFQPTTADLEQLSDSTLRQDLLGTAIAESLLEMRRWDPDRDESLKIRWLALCVRALGDEMLRARRMRQRDEHVLAGEQIFEYTLSSRARSGLDDDPETAAADGQILRTHLSALDPRDRNIVWAKASGYTTSEIAELLGDTSPRAVRARIKYLESRHPWIARL